MTNQNDFINLLLLFFAALFCLGCINLTPKRPPLWVVSLLWGMACFGISGLLPYLPGGRPYATRVFAFGTLGMMLGVFVTYYRSTERTLAYSVRKMAIQSMAFGMVLVLLLAVPIAVYFPSRDRVEQVTYMTLVQMQQSIARSEERAERRYQEMMRRMFVSDSTANARDSLYRQGNTQRQNRIINTQERVRRDLKQNQRDAAKQPKVIIVRPPKMGVVEQYQWYDAEAGGYRVANW